MTAEENWRQIQCHQIIYLDLHDLDLCKRQCNLSLIFPLPYVHNIMNLWSWSLNVVSRYTWQRSNSHFCTWWPWQCNDGPQKFSVLIPKDIPTLFTRSLPQSYSSSRNMKDITCSLHKIDTSSLSLTFILHWLTKFQQCFVIPLTYFHPTYHASPYIPFPRRVLTNKHPRKSPWNTIVDPSTDGQL